MRTASRRYCAVLPEHQHEADVEADLAERREPRHAEEQRAHDRPHAGPPEPVDLRVEVAAQAPADEPDHEQLARDEDRQRPARQQLEVPADGDAGDDQQAVDGGVQQRAHARVLARQARGDPVQVVAPGDHREHDHGRAADAVARGEREGEEDRDQREPDVADRVRDRPRVQRLARERLGRRRARAVQARQAPERQPRLLRRLLRARDRVLPGLARGAAAARVVAYGRLRHSSTAASAAPSSGMERVSRPRRTCASISPLASVRRPDGQAQRHAEQLGVRELLAGSGVAVVVDRLQAGLAQLLVEALGDLALLAAGLAEPDQVHVERAPSRPATRCPARRRTARRRRRRAARARARRSPSRSAASCRTRPGSSRRAGPSSACRA